MSCRSIYVAFIGFLLGIAAGTLSDFSYSTLLWLASVSLVLAVVWRRNRTAISAPLILSCSIAIAVFVVGALRVDIASWQFEYSSLEASVNQEVVFTGTVVREPDYGARTVHLYVKAEDELVLVTANRLQGVVYGDRVRITGDLSKPEAFTTDIGRTFNYPNYLLAKGVQYQVGFADVEVIDRNTGNLILAYLLAAKQSFVTQLDLVINEPAVGLGKGLLLGIKSALGEEIERDFRRAGLTHIVVLSGYNVMLVVAFILFCLSFVLGVKGRVVFGLLGIVAFALIVGLSATVVRASIMASLVLLAQLYGRRYDVLRALCMAGLVMILINPYILLYDVGFQLSFMATLGLVLMLPHFESTVATDTKRLQLKEFFLATVATQIAVLPLLWYHIGEVSIIAVLVNVLVLPIVPFAMLATFLAGVTAYISTNVAMVIGFVAWVLLEIILKIAHFASSLPIATITLPEVSPFIALALYVCMGAVWYFYKTKPAVKNEFADWTIVEEKDGASVDAPSQDTNDTPVFFR